LQQFTKSPAQIGGVFTGVAMACVGGITIIARDEALVQGACLALIVIGASLVSAVVAARAVTSSISRRVQSLEGSLSEMSVVLNAVYDETRTGVQLDRALWDAVRGVTATYDDGGHAGPTRVYIAR
jgi:hypothetical protein